MSESGSSVPSYISSLPSPLRRRHKDDLLAADSTVVCSARRYDCAPKDEYYNAWEEDIAVVNIFFGKDTVMGEINMISHIIIIFPELERSIRMGPVDFAASLGGLFGLCLGFSIISFIEIIYWIGAGVFRTLYNKI